jgi:hypothetical protein
MLESAPPLFPTWGVARLSGRRSLLQYCIRESVFLEPAGRESSDKSRRLEELALALFLDERRRSISTDRRLSDELRSLREPFV